MYRFREHVITRAGEAAYIIRAVGAAAHEEYLIMLANGTAKIVQAENLKPAVDLYRTGFGRAPWDGRERRGHERRAAERRHNLTAEAQALEAERRQAERRRDERRWVVMSNPERERKIG